MDRQLSPPMIAHDQSPQNHLPSAHFPLHYAAATGDMKTIRTINKHVGLSDLRDSGECTPLIYACWNGEEEVAMYLWRQGASVALVDQSMRDALFYACAMGHLSIVRMLLQDKNCPDPTELRERHRYDRRPRVEVTALERAAELGHTDVLKAILEYEDINMRKVTFKYHAACKTGKDESVALLVDVRNVNNFGSSKTMKNHPFRIFAMDHLMVAASAGHTRVVKILLDHGATEKVIALCFAAVNGHLDVVRVLLDHGTDPNALIQSHVMRHPRYAYQLLRVPLHMTPLHVLADAGRWKEENLAN